ncbi:ATP nucleotide 3'-pyrophosphokinase [Streptomyces sp. UNOC14_S4]|uniref:ATP nucleotide 3'-pyrophosphokinase n=1 Tax=Streptomyces sp. UNOC14_S4 TaxID=2872340 RepID=UPI001E482135|nr:ATP nucleotide 3'-pyrophosphokinase [Streptomyces sp. UNOC14_S4]MCC3769988.1 ATP nucleotide 3'-pyrophosphokinase [Streptomyces sp. UNOC14_S4]
MSINRTLHHAAAATALTAVLGAASVPGAFAQGPHPAPSGKAAARDGQRADGGGWRGGGLSLSASENRKVDEFLARARDAEQAISPEMRAVAVAGHATLIGFDQRLKSEDALKRSVASSLRSPGQSVDATLARIGDSLSYTLEWPDGRYAKGVSAVSSMLASWGNDNVRWANAWGRENSAKGIGSSWRDPQSGHVFEVQFHTPSSKWAQDVTRKLREEQRLRGTSAERAKELQEQQEAIFASVPVPDGAPALGAPPARRPVTATRTAQSAL